MNILSRLIHRLLRNVFFAKTFVFYKLYGVESVCVQLATCPRSYRTKLLKRYGAVIGKGATLKSNILIDNPSILNMGFKPFVNLKIGNGSYVGKAVYFDLFDQVDIGDKCSIAAGVKFVTHANVEADELRAFYPRQQEKIIIGEGTWIGVNAVILHGVNIGKMCVVGAGSVVTKDVPDFCVVVGSPARIVKKIKEK